MENKILSDFLEKYKNLDGPVDIRGIIENLGIIIEEVDSKEIKGCRTQINGKEIICISKNMDEKEKRFTLGHELCHFLLGEKGFSMGYGNTAFEEKTADSFSLKILLSKKSFIEKYKEFENIPNLSDYFGVPLEIIEKKLNNLLIK